MHLQTGTKKLPKTYLPCDVELIVTDKVRVVALERVKDERLVCLGDRGIREPTLVRQVHLSRERTRVQARGFHVEFEVNGFLRLDTNDQFIA